MIGKINATDSAIELAGELGIDIATVLGSGANGRILKKDVDLYGGGFSAITHPPTQATISPAANNQTPVWVKLVGSSRAILDGSYLLRGEARRVPFQIYEQARNGRPGDFAVKFDGSNKYLLEA